MSSGVFKSNIENVVLYKFGIGEVATPANSINILPQVIEVSIFESIFSPVLRAELSIFDSIGLFVNFPFTGEEIIRIEYRTYDDKIRSEIMVIESITDLTVANDNRNTIYVINAISLEAWQNARIRVQKAFNGISADAVKLIYDEYIVTPLVEIIPEYKPKVISTFPVDEESKLIIVPNLKPFAAINLIAEFAEPINKDSFSFMFYQDSRGYNFKTLQNMFEETRKGSARARAYKNKYRYRSDDIEIKDEDDYAKIVTSLTFNRRHSTLDKIHKGYFQNKLFEINMAQKSFFITERKASDVTNTIEKNKLNTQKYLDIVPLEGGNNDEMSNHTMYYINNQKENDQSFPISQKRERWGRDLIAHVAMSQIDITLTIQGDTQLNVGELFYLEVAESHGFNSNNDDDLISGYFLITEKRDTVTNNGTYTTSLRIQKDSYHSNVDRDSRLVYD